MRWVAVIAVIAIALMFLGGWLYFRDTGETSEVILDKQEVQEDTGAAVEEGKELMEKAAGEMRELGEEAGEVFSGDQTTQEEPSGKSQGNPQ